MRVYLTWVLLFFCISLCICCGCYLPLLLLLLLLEVQKHRGTCPDIIGSITRGSDCERRGRRRRRRRRFLCFSVRHSELLEI